MRLEEMADLLETEIAKYEAEKPDSKEEYTYKATYSGQYSFCYGAELAVKQSCFLSGASVTSTTELFGNEYLTTCEIIGTQEQLYRLRKDMVIFFRKSIRDKYDNKPEPIGCYFAPAIMTILLIMLFF